LPCCCCCTCGIAKHAGWILSFCRAYTCQLLLLQLVHHQHLLLLLLLQCGCNWAVECPVTKDGVRPTPAALQHRAVLCLVRLPAHVATHAWHSTALLLHWPWDSAAAAAVDTTSRCIDGLRLLLCAGGLLLLLLVVVCVWLH
jgi:hypothetical protein